MSSNPVLSSDGPDRLDVQESGRELVRSLHVCMRTARTHGWSNEASVAAVHALTRVLNAFGDARGVFTFHALGDHLFIDDDRLKSDATGYAFFEHLIRELNSRGIGSLAVSGPMTLQGTQQLLETLLAVSEEAATVDAPGALSAVNDRLTELELPLAVGPVRDGEGLDRTDDGDRRERAKKAFFKAVTVARAVLTSAHIGKRLDLRHAKRVVQSIVDLIMEEEFTLLGLTTLKDYDNYTFYHSVNVCIYSLALGKRAGLSRNQLSELGVAALLHDVGKTKIPVEILRKRGAFTPEEADVMKQHPELGVRELVKMKGLSGLAFKAMVASFEHHLNYDPKLTGYPKVRKPMRQHVIGRIVAIADCFDAMTTKRCYTPRAITRDKALAFMLSQAGQKFDPVLIKIFANLIGVFPVGTLVRLRSGRLAVVTRAAADPALCHRPAVRPITNEQGIEVDHPELDLARPGPNGVFADEILAAVNPESLGIELSRYFV